MILINDNALQFAMKNYDNRNCRTIEEFNEDYSKFLLIKRLLGRILNGQEANHRLILNHIIVTYNVFTVNAATALMFFRAGEEKWVLLNTFLTFLNYSPTVIPELNLDTSLIGIDQELLRTLRETI